MKCFSKKLLGHEIFSSIVLWATIYIFKNLQNPPAEPLPSPTYLMYSYQYIVLAKFSN